MKTTPQKRDARRGLVALELLELRVELSCEDQAFLDRVAWVFESPTSEERGASGPGTGFANSRGAPHLSVHVQVDRQRGGEAEEAVFSVKTEPPDGLRDLEHLSRDRYFVLVRALTQWAVVATRKFYVFHAGAVCRGGRGILLPGRSYGGKSTLTAAFLQRGFEFLSDEVGAIEVSTGCLTSFRRKFSLRAGSFDLLQIPEEAGVPFGTGPERWIGAEGVGGRRASCPARCSLVLIPNYRSGTATRFERLRTAEAVVRLMRTSCSQKVFKVPGLDFVIALARRVPVYEVTFSDWREVVEEAERIFESLEVEE